MHFRFLSSSRAFALGALALSFSIAGCSAGDETPGGGDGSGTGSTGSGASGNGTGSIPIDGSGSSGTGGGKYCGSETIKFEPRTPTVFILVDQSGSMFGGGTPNLWTSVRDAALPVVQELQAEVRFGIGTFNSVNAGGTCPASVVNDLGTIAQNNFDAINTFYTTIPTTPPSGKVDTPTMRAIDDTVTLLDADGSNGPRAILLVTSDDDPDYCDDVGQQCGNDGIIGALQMAYSNGVQTFVFGLDNLSIEHKDWFDMWAQAGKGEKPNWTDGLTVDPNSGGKIENECGGNTGWKAQWTAAGRTGELPIGEYSAAGGTAKAFVSADTSAVADEIRSKVQGLKSCTFDLPNIKIKKGSEKRADIKVDNVLIPADQWNTVSIDPAVIEITGAACDTWKKPEVTDFFAGFACDAYIVK